MSAAPVLSRVTALLRRDLIIELSYSFQLFIRFVSIAMAVAMFFFLGRLVGEAEQLAAFEGGYFEFVIIGLVVMQYSQACVNSFSQSMQRAQADGTLEILLSTATRLPTLLTGTLLVPLLLASVEASLFLVVGAVFGQLDFRFGEVALSGILLLLTLGTFAAIGILSATVIVLTKRGDPFSSLALQASNLLAGAVFPVAVLPPALQLLSKLVPATYGLRGVRTVMLADGGVADVAFEMLVLVGFNVVLLPVATWSLSRALRIARVTGTLGNR